MGCLTYPNAKANRRKVSSAQNEKPVTDSPHQTVNTYRATSEKCRGSITDALTIGTITDMGKMKNILANDLYEGDVDRLVEIIEAGKTKFVPAEIRNDARITELCEQYQYLIVKEHHKDRDCHWRIDHIWSYGEDQLWRVLHSGYCYKDVEINASSYLEAQQIMIEELTTAIEEVKMAFSGLEIEE